MKILVLNAGSSSLKFDLFETSAAAIAANEDRLLHHGSIDRVSSMRDAFAGALEQFSPSLNEGRVDAVGHRVVHGGDTFHESVLIDEGVERRIEALGALAPLHNPHNLEGIRAARAHFPDTKQVAVFDTAFHHTLPPKAYAYGLPYEYLAEKKIRRYGFHGISHRYVSGRFAQLHAGRREDYRMITCHLGNGCSICAIDHGASVDTSMGFTPLEGLVMGARSGDVDAGAILYLITNEGSSAPDVRHMLNADSGLKGLSGISNDMRDVLDAEEKGIARARLAIDVFCYRAKKYIGAYLAAMGGAEALIFTGGIGENSAAIRERICSGLEQLGVALDQERNARPDQRDRQIGMSRVQTWVIPTNEELLIARDTFRCVSGPPHQ
ncbi:MAG TPA: acetate kinase [Bryobacteraceae bacterium]|nr:acetate kinase [Bryobacteraceae bacterium]